MLSLLLLALFSLISFPSLQAIDPLPVPYPPHFPTTMLQLNSGWAKVAYNTSITPWITSQYVLDAPVPVQFQFTDAFCPGERVSIYINGTFFMNSTEVPVPSSNSSCYPNLALPEGTFGYPDVYSQASATLPAGQHTITLLLIQSNPKFVAGLMFMRAFIYFESCTECTAWSKRAQIKENLSLCTNPGTVCLNWAIICDPQFRQPQLPFLLAREALRIQLKNDQSLIILFRSAH